LNVFFLLGDIESWKCKGVTKKQVENYLFDKGVGLETVVIVVNKFTKEMKARRYKIKQDGRNFHIQNILGIY